MKRNLIASGAVASIMLLAACSGDPAPTADPTTGNDVTTEAPADEGSGGTPESAGELEIWVDDTRLQALADSAAEFEAQTGVKVNLIEKDFQDISEDFITMQPNGEGADVIVTAHDGLGQLVTNGVLAPLEFGDKADQFAPAAIQAVTYDSTVYGLPYAVENLALLRNDDVTTADIPATFDELIELGKSLDVKYPVMIQQDAANGDPYTVYPIQTSFGAPAFKTDADGNYTSELAMGGPEGEEFAKYLKTLGDEGVLNGSNGYDIVLQSFIDGDTPFIVGGPWMISAIRDAGVNVSVHPIPSAGGEEAQPFLGVQAFFINADAKNPIAANEFVLNYMATEEVQLALYEVGDRTPALLSAAEKVASDPIAAGFAEAGENGVPMPAIPAMSAIWEFLGATQIGIAEGKGDPVELWSTMIENVENAINN